MIDSKNLPLTIGALVAVLAIVLGRGAAAPAVPKSSDKPAAAAAGQKSPQPPSPPTPTECSRWCEPIRLYEEYFGLPASGSLSPILANALEQRYTLDVLIALIPDPIDAGMTYRSDEALEAIQRGLSSDGLLFDRQWLPWQGEAAKVHKYRQEPGAILFRSSSPRRLTLVLLVGETVKGGLHKAAFFEALDLTQKVRSPASKPGPIRILGPTFSGSTESLQISIDRWLGQRLGNANVQGGPPEPPLGGIRIVTGSATAPGLEEIFDQSFGRQVVLERTIVPDDELQWRAYSYLHEKLGWDFEHVALMSEFDTVYGQEAHNPIHQEARNSIYREVAPKPRLLGQFPSHLARLRIAREKKGLSEKSSESKEISSSAPKLLDLSLSEDEQEPVDVIPQLSSLSTASNDLALLNQLDAVCHRGVRYVGVLATDIRDRLFLAEHIRNLCPDVVLFTFDNHLLSSHPQLTSSMEGSLVLASFPLAVSAEGDRVAYTSEFQQGIVLAVRQLLREGPGPPRVPWIAAVGKGRLWPLVRLGEGAGSSAQRFTIAGTEGVAFKWIAASAVIALLAAWLWRTARPVQLLDDAIWMAPGGIPGLRFFPLVGIGTLIVACGVLLVFYSLPLLNRNEFQADFLTGRVIGWGLNLVVLAAVYGILIAACAWLARAASRRRFGLWRILGWIAGAFFLLLVLSVALPALWVLPGGEEFFYARAGDFASGLSPLVSLAFVLAAIFSWALLGIRRRRMSLLQEVRWPLSPALAGEPLATGGRLAAELDRMLWAWFPGPWFWAGIAAALLVPARRLLGIQPIAEPAAYGWVFLALVGLGFILGAIAFARFVQVWWRLESILELLCHTWLLGAFRADGNASFYGWKPLRSFSWRMPRHSISLLSAEALRALTRRGVLGADGAALAPSGALDRELGTVFQAAQDGDLEAEVRARNELGKWFVKSGHALERARPELPADQEAVAHEVDRFLSLRVVGWVRYVFGHLRYSLISAMMCGLFILVGTSAYAFQPKRYLSFGIWAALLSGSLLTLWIFVRMDRNAVLSAIGGSDAGKVSFDRTFFSNLLTYGGVPVLGVILTQFPAVGSVLGQWLQPLLRLLVGS